MKKYFLIYALALCALVGCKDNSGLSGLLNDYDYRISALEQLCKQLNTNVDALQTIINAQQTGDYITAITPIKENGVEIGYTITFAKHNPVTIYHGKDGADGKDGQNGKDGKDGQNGTNGTNGTDGHTPIIGVAKDTDGVYYWTLDGDWLLDSNGNKLRVTGEDGKDGKDGQNGQNGTNGTNGTNGVTPQLKIEGDYWYISYDAGATWTQLGKAKGEDGTNGTNGTDGQDGDSMFQSVTQDEDNVYFTLENGTLITLSKSTGVSNHLSKENGHYYVDLGLPSGTMWATCNLGGYYPGDYGDFYHFGATTPETMLAADAVFVVDGITIGENGSIAGSSYDAARTNWGGKWKTPTKSEWEELKNNCIFHYTTALNRDGVSVEGVLLKSTINGKSLFLVFDDVPPVKPDVNVGYTLNEMTTYGNYMTSTIAHIYSTYYEAFYYMISHRDGYQSSSNIYGDIINSTSKYLKSNESTFRMIRPVFHP